MIVPNNLPVNNMQEFIAYVKANQTTVQFASAGPGSASHVSCILLNAMLGVNVTHVPYRGLSVAMQDLIAGRVHYICDSVSTSKPQIEGEQVKGIATTGLRRSPALPNIPTVKEQGLDFDVLTWQGLFLAKGTPEPVVRRLNERSARPRSAFRARAFRRVGEEIAGAGSPKRRIFRQVRLRRDRALEGADQGERRHRGVTCAAGHERAGPAISFR